MTTELEFKECAVCAAKPGSPMLCEACIHNRLVVSKLQSRAAEGTALVQENEDLWREVAALASDLNAHKATLLGLQADVQGFLGFAPKSAQATMKLFQQAFLLAMRDADFKKEHEKQMLDWRKRLGKAITEQRDLRLMEEKVDELSRGIREVEQTLASASSRP